MAHGAASAPQYDIARAQNAAARYVSFFAEESTVVEDTGGERVPKAGRHECRGAGDRRQVISASYSQYCDIA